MKKNIYTPLLNGFVYVDFDVDNPACSKHNPFVRIGYVDNLPETEEEHAQFVAEHKIIGKKRDIFGKISLSKTGEIFQIMRLWIYHCIDEVENFGWGLFEEHEGLGDLITLLAQDSRAYRMK